LRQEGPADAVWSAEDDESEVESEESDESDESEEGDDVRLAILPKKAAASHLPATIGAGATTSMARSMGEWLKSDGSPNGRLREGTAPR
jgi:hypothetical protein